MNDFERSLQEWMHDDRPGVSPWVLDSAMGHAREHSNQSRWRRLLGRTLEALPAGPDAELQHVRRAPVWATVIVLSALLLALAVLVPPVAPEPDRAPAVAPASPATEATPLALPPTPPPDGGAGFDTSGGLVGSLWLEQADGAFDSYVTLHPDGTLVRATAQPRHPVGIGVWRPTGERSLTGVIAYPDADPVNHTRPGFSSYRVDWTLDEAATGGTLTWSAETHPADGSPGSVASGSARLERMSRLSLPAEAAYPAPAEPGWELALGPMALGSASGTVLTTVDDRCECVTPDYVITHGDGTTFMTSCATGNGPGLWVPTGPDTRALSWWLSGTPGYDMWPVSQLAGSDTMALSSGDSERFYYFDAADTLAFEDVKGSGSAVDAASWPETGSVWLEATDGGTAITAYLSDGTIVTRDPRYGAGVGYWRPLDEDTITAWVGFTTNASQDHQRWSEATTSTDAQTLSIEYRHQDLSGGPAETGSTSATRLRIEP
jgi:hypothetical protein